MPRKTKHEIAIRSAAVEYLTFVSTIGDQPESVGLRYEDENVWLTQRMMAELYGFQSANIYHFIAFCNYHSDIFYAVSRKSVIVPSLTGESEIMNERRNNYFSYKQTNKFTPF